MRFPPRPSVAPRRHTAGHGIAGMRRNENRLVTHYDMCVGGPLRAVWDCDLVGKLIPAPALRPRRYATLSEIVNPNGGMGGCAAPGRVLFNDVGDHCDLVSVLFVDPGQRAAPRAPA